MITVELQEEGLDLGTYDACLNMLSMNDIPLMAEDPYKYCAIKWGLCEEGGLYTTMVEAVESTFPISMLPVQIANAMRTNPADHAFKFDEINLDTYQALSTPKRAGMKYDEPLWIPVWKGFFDYEATSDFLKLLGLLDLMNLPLSESLPVMAHIYKQLEQHFKTWSDLYKGSYVIPNAIPSAKNILKLVEWDVIKLNIANKYNYKIEEVESLPIWRIFMILRTEGILNVTLYQQQKQKK